tara:strand:- start:491 stop:700 length:210 start_codon:yes stop_codon:yes gene_type:complete
VADLLAVVLVVNKVSVDKNPSISYTSNNLGSVYTKNYIAVPHDTEQIPYEFVNDNTAAPDVAVLTMADI